MKKFCVVVTIIAAATVSAISCFGKAVREELGLESDEKYFDNILSR